MMDSRDRVLAALSHKEPDRVPITDRFWPSTLRRWHREGLAQDRTPADEFDYDIVSIRLDCTLQLPERIVEETDEFFVKWNSNGALIKDWKVAASVPETREFSITDRQKWDELKPRLTMNDQRLNWDESLEIYENARKAGKFVLLDTGTGFGEAHRLVGVEDLLIAMADEPEWVRDMFHAFAQLTVDAVEETTGRGIELDGVFMRNDMGYRNALLFSPRMYSELLFPFDKMICSHLAAKTIAPILHSDGRVRSLIPKLIEAGFTCLNPLEVKAGMDLAQLKAEYGGQMAFMGGIDVRKMSAPDPLEIEEEIRERFAVGMVGGGYIYHSDHSVPDDVSWQRYEMIMDLVRQYGVYRHA